MPYSDPTERARYLREYKQKHKRIGPPQKVGVKEKPTEQYELDAVRTESGCLIYPAWTVARRLFFRRHPEIPKHLLVCHTCDNPQCIEDKHHFAGTPIQNIMDSVRKGRHSSVNQLGKKRK